MQANVQYAISKDNGNKFEPDGYLTDYLADEACNAIEANKNHPFFLYLAFTAPHTPLQALQSDYDALSHIPDELTRVYGAMILALDRGVGKVLDTLKKNGLDDNTLVIFTNDNGAPNWIMRPDINAPYRGWKGTFFQGGIRVPLFMKWPGQIAAGSQIEESVSHIDLFPTIAAAAVGLKSDSSIVPEIDGVNLLPFIRSSSVSSSEQKCVNNELCTVPAEEAIDRHRALFWRSGHYKCLVMGQWKLQISSNPKKMWLYNLAEDPQEHINLAENSAFGAIRDELHRELLNQDGAQRTPLWPAITETAVLVDKLFEFNETLEDEYIYWPN